MLIQDALCLIVLDPLCAMHCSGRCGGDTGHELTCTSDIVLHVLHIVVHLIFKKEMIIVCIGSTSEMLITSTYPFIVTKSLISLESIGNI